MRRISLAAVVTAVALIAVHSSASAANVLIYGPSESGSDGDFESDVATDAGHTVSVASESTWAGLTTADFSGFDAIVFGMGATCDSLDGAEANRGAWSPAVTGGIVASTFDNHEDNGGPNQVAELINNEINFAAAGPGTGLSVLCAWGPGGTVTLLDQFGNFELEVADRDDIAILDSSHPVIAGPPTLTNSGLSDWGNSTHAGFTAFPASFEVIAQSEDASPTLPVLIAKDPPVTSGTCKGQTATITGTEQDDVLTGTDEADVIAALGGNDQVRSLGGNDLVCGAAGKDVLRGGKNKDKLLGQAGKDKLRGQGGKDRLLGKGGKDKLNGGTAKDVCNGGKKDDTAKKCEVEKSI